MHQRLNPSEIYAPAKGCYSQVVVSTGATHYHLFGLAGCNPDWLLPDTVAEQAAHTMSNLDVALKSSGSAP